MDGLEQVAPATFGLEIREEVHLRRVGFREVVLVLYHVLRLWALFLLLGFHGVKFEVGEDGLGALDDDFRKAGETGDLDAVALVRGTGEDLVEEDDLLVPFSNGDVVVGDGLFGVGEIC